MSSLLSLGAGLGYSNQSTNTNQSFNQNQTASGTSTYNRTLTPYQDSLQSPLFSLISQLMLDPNKAIAPFHTAARDQVSGNYSGLADSLRNQFLSTGGGKSGKFGMALTAGDLARRSDLSKTDTSFGTAAAELPLTAASLASQLLGMNFGGVTDTTGESSTSGTSASKSKTSGFSLSLGGVGK